MRKTIKAACGAAVVAAALSVLVGGAQASRLSLASISWRAVWAPVTITGGTSSVRCDLTLEGTFHTRTFPKTGLALIGQLTRATVQACTGGAVTLLTETLPWHLQYGAYTGTLPFIGSVGVLLVGFRFRVQPTGQLACLTGTTQTEPAVLVFALDAAGEVTEINWNPLYEIQFGPVLCPWANAVTVSGNGTATVQGGMARITVALI